MPPWCQRGASSRAGKKQRSSAAGGRRYGPLRAELDPTQDICTMELAGRPMDLIRSEVTTEPLRFAGDRQSSLSSMNRNFTRRSSLRAGNRGDTSSGTEGLGQKCLLTCLSESGCRDLNPGPLDPQSSALTKLRHSPCVVEALRTGANPGSSAGASPGPERPEDGTPPRSVGCPESEFPQVPAVATKNCA